MSKKSLYLCISGIAFLVAAPAFAASIQMLPPVESTDPTDTCTASANSKILSWDGSTTIKCQSNIVVDSSGHVGIGASTLTAPLTIGNNTSGGMITLGATDSVREGAQINLNGAASYNPWYIDLYDNALRLFSNSTNNNQVQIFNNGTGVSGLYVEGAVQVGNDAAACSATTAGTIKWNGTSFKLCDGTGWKSLGTKRYSVTAAVISGNCPDAVVPNPDPWTSGYTGTTYVDMLYRWVNTCGARYCRALGEGYVTGKVTEYFGGNAEVDCW